MSQDTHQSHRDIPHQGPCIYLWSVQDEIINWACMQDSRKVFLCFKVEVPFYIVVSVPNLGYAVAGGVVMYSGCNVHCS